MLDVDSSQLKTSLTYKEHSEFVRLSEFFNGLENTGQRLIVRSQSDSRSGLYFSLNLKVLELGMNGLSAIPHNLFKPLRNLENLDLSQNHIKKILRSNFDGLSKFKSPEFRGE